MNVRQGVALPRLATGVPGLDEVLGGGLPEYAFTLVTGIAGAGKTTLAHQLMFANASPTRPALYFTVMGEPPLKMLRYQQQFAYFDVAQIGTSIHYIDLSELVLSDGLEAVLARIVAEVVARGPGLVFVDSFQVIVRVAAANAGGSVDLQSFVQRLAIQLTTWQATTFLIGEQLAVELDHIPLRTVADGILTLSQENTRNAIVRKLQVTKLRGQAPMPGLHTMRISAAGIQVFPRLNIAVAEADRERAQGRDSTGVPGLDALVGGGIPTGDAVLISGASGTGKSLLATQFIAAGVRAGEPGVIAVFEEHPKEYMRRATGLGIDLEQMERDGQLQMIYIRPLDLSPDETLYEIRTAVAAVGARRVVIDSISGFELALAPSFRDDFRESLYRLVGALTGTGITVLMTMEIVQRATDLRFSPYVVSFLADDILLLRYVEIGGQLRKSFVVVKMRNSNHSSALRLYDITAQGMIVGGSLADYTGIGTGIAERRAGALEASPTGLTPAESAVLATLVELQEATVAAIAQRSGQPAEPLEATLLRLVALNYAVTLEQADGWRYRAVAQALP